MDDNQQLIGIPNDNGNTVLRTIPQRIKLVGFHATLDMHTGPSYTILMGIWAGEVVQPGDYVGELGAYWRPSSWLVCNPTMWEAVQVG